VCSSQTVASALARTEGPNEQNLGAQVRLNINFIAVCECVQERELCAQARLLPVHYLEVKALMMREGQTKGYISRQEARTFFRLEPAKAVRQAQPSFFLLFLCFLISYCLQAGARQGSQAGTTFLLLACSLFLDLILSSGWNPPKQSGRDNLPSSCFSSFFDLVVCMQLLLP